MCLDAAMWNSVLESYKLKPAELDRLGLKVAGLKTDYLEMVQLTITSQATKTRDNLTTTSALLTRAVTIDLRLKTWEAGLQPDWFPVSLATFSAHGGPNPNLYGMNQLRDTFDSYPSVEVADTMNRYRVYRLICLQIMRSCHLMQTSEENTHRSLLQQQFQPGTLNEHKFIGHQIQKLADQICNSVAFHMGNVHAAKTHLTTLSSSCSEAPTSCSASGTPRGPVPSGSWYILGPLSFLARDFSVELGQGIQPPLLREGQLEWIKMRLLRIMRMLGLTGEPKISDDDHFKRLRVSLQYTPGA